MVFKYAGSSIGFEAARGTSTKHSGAVYRLANWLTLACGLFWADSARPASWDPAACASANAADAKFVIGCLCGLAVAVLIGGCFSLLKSAVAKREQAAMTSWLAHQDHTARQFQDDLVQGVQGLVTTLELMAQNDPTARSAIEDALRRAETFLLAMRAFQIPARHP